MTKPEGPRESPASGAQSSDDSAPTRVPDTTQPPLPIVAIGASAGGVEALERLFSALPADTGAAFLVLVHHHPDARSLLAHVIARHTRMRVEDATNGLVPQANHVYVTLPGTEIRYVEGALHVAPLAERVRPHMIIDTVLRSLAAEAGARTIAVILSGTGRDGTLGLEALKEAGGFGIAQAESSARFRGMPASAAATGLVDRIEPVENIPAAIVEAIRTLSAGTGKSDAALQALLPQIFLRILNKTGHDVSRYKPSTVIRRITRRMQACRLTSPEDYLQLLHRDAAEVETLYKNILITVTSFFRDPHAFEALYTQVITPLCTQPNVEAPIRIWVPGCATGEEAYSIAILVAEGMARSGNSRNVQIFGTDVDERALETARAGKYPREIATLVGQDRLDAYFEEQPDGYLIRKPIREMLMFSLHDLVRDPPFSRLDLISCRNVLIYMSAELQNRVMPLLHFALKTEGALFLGPSESIGKHNNLYATIDKHHRLYRARAVSFPRHALDFPSLAPLSSPPELQTEVPIAAASRTTLAGRALRLLADRYAPAGVVVDDDWVIQHFQGHTARWLEAPSGAPDLHILGMARYGLRAALRKALEQSAKSGRTVVSEGIRITTEGRSETVRLTVIPLTDDSRPAPATVVLFESDGESAPPASGKVTPARTREEELDAVAAVERELRSTRDTLQTTIEEHETSNEELKSANEELVSMNEELQSANEELESSKEELQSVNEELSTVNSELTNKVEELTRANSDVQNLLAASRIATVFLGPDLRVRSFTPSVAPIFKLISTDIGRPITDIAASIPVDTLRNASRRTLQTLAVEEMEIRSVDDRWYVMRFAPYRTIDNVIDGVVLTLNDVTDLKRAAFQSELLAAVVESSPEAIAVLDLEGRILEWNPGAERLYGYSEKVARKMNYSALVPADRRATLRDRLARAAAGEPFDMLEAVRITAAGGRREVWLSIRPIRDADGSVQAIAVTERDITDRQRNERALNEAHQQLEARVREISRQHGNIVASSPEAIITTDASNRIISWNASAERLFGYSSIEALGAEITMLIPVGQDLGAPELGQIGADLVDRVPETTRVRKDGSAIHVSLSVSQLIDGRGGGTGKLIMYNDESERIRTRAALESARSDAATRQRLADLGALMAEVVHDLGNPLGALALQLQLLLRMTAPPGFDHPQVHELAEKLLNTTSRMSAILRDFKGVARRQPLQLAATDLLVLLSRLAETWSAYAAEHGARLEIELPETLPTIEADADKLTCAFENLVKNAIEAIDTPPGVVTVTATLLSPERILVTVADTGKGIPADFEPFKLRSTSKVDGTGLGLAIARQIVESHRGRLGYHGRLDDSGPAGTVFEVELPVNAAPT